MFSKAPSPPRDSDGCQGGALLGDPADTGSHTPFPCSLPPFSSSHVQAVGTLLEAPGSFLLPAAAYSLSRSCRSTLLVGAASRLCTKSPAGFQSLQDTAGLALTSREPSLPGQFGALSGGEENVRTPLFHDQKHVGVPGVSSSCTGDVTHVLQHTDRLFSRPVPTPRPCSTR